MPETKVELVRRAIEAFNRRDFDAMAEVSHEDLEFTSVLTAVDAGAATYRGKGAWTSYFAVMDETWDAWRIEDAEILDAGGDAVAAVLRLVGTGRHSGAAVERTVGLTYRIRDGQLWNVHAYLEPADALASVGLST